MPGRSCPPPGSPSPDRTAGVPVRLAVTATAAALLVQPFVAAPASAATTVKPRSLAALPTQLDVVPTYQDQRSCDPAAKPGVEAFARMVLTTYRQGRNGGIVRGCGLGATSEHKEGRAFDWMLSVNVPAEKAAGDAFTSWLTGPDSHGVVGGNARRLGVMYVIWNRRIWATYAASRGWRPYSGASEHTDHVHTSFTWDGAMRRTSWWDGSATADEDKGPCRVYAGQPAPLHTGRHTAGCPANLPAAPSSPYPVVWPGQSGASVKVAQSRLGLGADGVFGSGTRSRLMGWQRGRVPVTGVLDKPTWSRLAPSGSSATPSSPTPSTPSTPSIPSPSTPSTSDKRLAATTTLTPYKGTTVRQGSRGPAARALQKALGIPADGAFGPATTSAVKAFQAARRLPATGVVNRATWDAVERAAYPLLPYRATVLSSGSRGAAVTALQQALRLAADGAFGARTRAAVQAAQTRAKRPATGVVDVRTWLAIEQQSYPLGRRLVSTPVVTGAPKPAPKPSPKPAPKPAPAPAPSAATATSVSPYKATVLRLGSRGNAVKALQRALGMPAADGAYGAQTAGTVARFQAARKLRKTGVVDRATWNQVEQVAHPLLPFRRTVVRQGSRGAAVAALQRALHLPADGAFGAQTATAVRTAQARARLKATGSVDTATWLAVEKQAYPLGVRRW